MGLFSYKIGQLMRISFAKFITWENFLSMNI